MLSHEAFVLKKKWHCNIQQKVNPLFILLLNIYERKLKLVQI